MLAKKNIFLLLILCLMSTMVVQAQEFVEPAFEDAQAESELDPICEETESLEATMEPGQSLESDFTEGLLPSLEGDTTSEAAPEDLEVPMAEASEEAFGDSVFETEEADAQADSGSPVPLFASALDEADESEDFSADETVGESQTLDIGDYTYYIVDGNASISKYNGKDSVVTIPTSFSYGGLTYKVRQVNNFAFENCSSLQTLVIPDGITSIGYGAFRNCTSLSNITIDTNLADCSSYNSYNGVKYINGDRKDPVYAYTSPFYNVGANSSSLTVTFGEHVKHVCAYLFATGASEGDMCYAHVTKVVIGKNVERIGNCAFYHCYDLTEVVIGEKVTNIGDYSFSNDKHLSSITWGQSLREIESYAFYNCDQLASINIPEKVTTLGSFAFETCEGLTSIVLPSTLCRMDYGVFRNCTKLEKIMINGDLYNHSDCNTKNYSQYLDGGSRDPAYAYTSPFYNAGANASKLVISFGQGVTRVPNYLFATASSYSDGVHCHVTEVILPDTVTAVGKAAFYNCMDLKTLKMGRGVTNLGIDSFAYCINLTDIEWSNNLREIGSCAFYDCNSLTTVNLPENVTTIQYGAFKWCDSLTNVTLPSSTTALHYAVFQECKKLSSLTICGNLGDMSSYNINSSRQYIDGGAREPAYAYTSPFYNAGANADSFTVTFANGITRIPAYIFGTGGAQSDNRYAAVTKVVIPASVTSIANGAFYACYRLSEISYMSDQNHWEKITVEGNNTHLVEAKKTFKDVPEISAPALKGAILTTSGVKLSWETVPEATAYRVLRKEDWSDTWTTIQDTPYLEYIDTSAVSGTTYQYAVLAVRDDIVSEMGDPLSIKYLAAPKITAAVNEKTGVFLTWQVVEGAEAYRVFKRTSDGKWKKLGDTRTLVFLDETVTGGSTYTYTVRCISEDGTAYTSAYYAAGKKQKFIAAPALKSAKNSSAGVVKVKWTKSKGASKYQILRRTESESWSIVGTSKGSSFKDKTVRKGTTYYYTVVCISSKGANISAKNEPGLKVTVSK